MSAGEGWFVAIVVVLVLALSWGKETVCEDTMRAVYCHTTHGN
jgi:hypothetical protein